MSTPEPQPDLPGGRQPPSLRPGAPGGKRDQNRRLRITVLTDVGLQLFLSRGVEGVAIDDLVRAAAMAKGSFYRYFRDKADLVEAILRPVSADVESALDDCEAALSGADDAATLLAAYAGLANRLSTVAATNPDVVRLYLQECRAPALGARVAIGALAQVIRTRSVRLTEIAVAHGLLDVAEPRVTAWAVVGAVEQLALEAQRGELDMDPTTIGETLIGLVLRGIGS